MTKIYRGMPGGQVTVEDGGKVTVLPAVQYDAKNHRLVPYKGQLGWGKGNGGKEGANLALSLAVHALGDDRTAIDVYQRLKYRTVMAWPDGGSWSINERDLLAHVDDIRDIEKSTAMARTIVNQQPAPVVYEGGPGIGGIPIRRSDKDQGPGPEVPPDRRAAAAHALMPPEASPELLGPNSHQRPSNERDEASRPDDWPEKVDGFRRTAGDFLASTRLVYCLVLCDCYSWQDAAGVSQERLAAIPEWSDGLMAEMLDALSRRGIAYAARERRQEILKGALAKLSLEEKEALGLK